MMRILSVMGPKLRWRFEGVAQLLQKDDAQPHEILPHCAVGSSAYSNHPSHLGGHLCISGREFQLEFAVALHPVLATGRIVLWKT